MRSNLCQSTSINSEDLITNSIYNAPVFKIRIFNLASYFSWKAHQPLNHNKEIQKSAMGLGVTVTYAHSMGSFYFAIQIIWNHLFLMSLTNFFPSMLSLFHQNLSHHLIIKQIPTIWSFKPTKSNQFKEDIKSRPGLRWNADMWAWQDSMSNTESFTDVESNCQN